MAYARLLLAGLATTLVACEGKTRGSNEAPPAVPVTVMTLEEIEPARPGRRMGLAQPYREEAIGFEVTGRIMKVVDVGVELDGPAQDNQGVLVRQGDIIANLDPTRYDQKVSSVELRIAAEQAELKAKTIDLEGVAQAQADLAKVTYERQLSLDEAGATTKEALDTAKANLDVAAATLELKKAQLLAKAARINELREDLRSAKLDQEDCVLRAPFSGRITQQHLSRGAFAKPGAPVVTLTLIDPINITLTLSAKDERRLVIGSPAKLYPSGAKNGSALPGRIRGKGQVADPRTRTFLVEIITRNLRYEIASPLSTVDKLVPIMTRYFDEKGPLFVPNDAVIDAGGQSSLLVIRREQIFGEHTKDPTKTLKPHKVAVTLGERYWTVLDWHLREVSGEGLRAKDFVVRAPSKADAVSVDTHLFQWLIRPGDLVPVSFDLGALPRGFYVPVTAVKELNGRTWVFVVEEGKAKRIAVTTHESFEDKRRIEGEGLTSGAQLVIKGVHYVADGFLVNLQGGA